MSTATLRLPFQRIRCYYQPMILTTVGLIILGTFWFVSRYPQLLAKAEHLGKALPTMAYSSELFVVTADTPVLQTIVFSAVNWLNSMKIGMTFGVLFGALLHTVLRHYPLKIGRNLYLNSLKGALVGAPMGVCANCAVPAACGVTRGHGRVEVALGFLFSSPNFNPVVMTMTFTALPLAMGLTKYAILLTVILFVVPAVIGWLERKKPLDTLTFGEDLSACEIPLKSADCTKSFGEVFKDFVWDYGKHVWMLLKPTIAIMLFASVVAAAMLILIPWNEFLSEANPWRFALASLISVFMPVPIALDVMFAFQLQQQGIANGYVMMFLLTLGTYSIVPTIYLWREVSKALSVILFAFFMVSGWVMGLIF